MALTHASHVVGHAKLIFPAQRALSPPSRVKMETPVVVELERKHATSDESDVLSVAGTTTASDKGTFENEHLTVKFTEGDTSNQVLLTVNDKTDRVVNFFADLDHEADDRINESGKITLDGKDPLSVTYNIVVNPEADVVEANGETPARSIKSQIAIQQGHRFDDLTEGTSEILTLTNEFIAYTDENGHPVVRMVRRDGSGLTTLAKIETGDTERFEEIVDEVENTKTLQLEDDEASAESWTEQTLVTNSVLDKLIMDTMAYLRHANKPKPYHIMVGNGRRRIRL